MKQQFKQLYSGSSLYVCSAPLLRRKLAHPRRSLLADSFHLRHGHRTDKLHPLGCTRYNYSREHPRPAVVRCIPFVFEFSALRLRRRVSRRLSVPRQLSWVLSAAPGLLKLVLRLCKRQAERIGEEATVPGDKRVLGAALFVFRRVFPRPSRYSCSWTAQRTGDARFHHSTRPVSPNTRLQVRPSRSTVPPLRWPGRPQHPARVTEDRKPVASRATSLYHLLLSH